MLLRVVTTLILILLAFSIPWWVNILLIISAGFYFRNFYEAVFIGFMMDSIFASHTMFETFPYILTLVFLILIFVINKIRQTMIMY